MSEPNGLGSEPRAAAQHLADTAAEDPWFGPGPKPNGYQSLATDQHGVGTADPAAADAKPGPDTGSAPGDSDAKRPFEGPHRSEEWFLPAGRVGLMPEWMTETRDSAAPDTERHEPAGAPPWASDQPAQDVAEPPPWESGPWPGPGEARPAGRTAATRRPVIARPPADTVNWQAKAALVAGILPLILPGAVLGVLGLRQAKATGTGRLASWAGIGLSAIWAVLVIVVAAGGTSPPGCTAAAQASVNRAMQTVLSDLSAGAPPRMVSASLAHALSTANAAAVGTQQVAASSALVTLTNSLSRAVAVVNASHSTANYAALRTQLATADTAVRSACAG